LLSTCLISLPAVFLTILSRIAARFAKNVFQLLLDAKPITEDVAEDMKSWERSGFMFTWPNQHRQKIPTPLLCFDQSHSL